MAGTVHIGVALPPKRWAITLRPHSSGSTSNEATLRLVEVGIHDGPPHILRDRHPGLVYIKLQMPAYLDLRPRTRVAVNTYVNLRIQGRRLSEAPQNPDAGPSSTQRWHQDAGINKCLQKLAQRATKNIRVLIMRRSTPYERSSGYLESEGQIDGLLLYRSRSRLTPD